MEPSEYERTGLKLSYEEMTLCLGWLTSSQPHTAADEHWIRQLTDEIGRQQERQKDSPQFSGKSRTFLCHAAELLRLQQCLPSLSLLRASPCPEDKQRAVGIRSLRIRLSEAHDRLTAPYQQREAERRARLIAEYEKSKS